MLPVCTTIKPAPADTLTSETVISKFLGLVNSFGLSDNEYWVLAMHTGRFE